MDTPHQRESSVSAPQGGALSSLTGMATSSTGRSVLVAPFSAAEDVHDLERNNLMLNLYSLFHCFLCVANLTLINAAIYNCRTDVPPSHDSYLSSLMALP